MRIAGRFVLGLAVAAALLTGAAVSFGRISASNASASRGLPADIPLAADKSLGVNIDLSQLGAKARENTLTAIEAAGFRWLRMRFDWAAIEPRRGVLIWDTTDAIVPDVARHRLNLIAVLDGAPEWARAAIDRDNPLAPPAEARDFGQFAAAFAARYGDRIDHYQVWDEPNIAPHWGAQEVDPAAYTHLLRDAAIEIRNADPDAVLLAAALAPNVERGGANMSELDYLDRLYQEGAADWFDVLAAQPYGFDQPVAAPPDPTRLNWTRVALLRRIMDAHGDGATPVWAVSFGWKPSTEQHPTGTGDDGVAQLLCQTRTDWPWLGPMLWAAWSEADRHGEYALVGKDGHIVGDALGALVTTSKGPALAWPGVYPADHPSGQYEGKWRLAAGQADIGGSGDRLVVDFYGTRLDLAVRRGPYRAFLFVQVDGKPTSSLPKDQDGRAYLVLYDPLRAKESVTIARGLPEGRHRAEIVAERGWGQWAIVGWRVSVERDRAQAWLPAALGLAAMAVLAVTVHVGWRQRESLASTMDVVQAGFQRLDDRLLLLAAAVVLVLLYAVDAPLPSLAAVVVLALLLVGRPALGPPLIAATLPFYQLGVPLLRKVFSPVEILTLLTVVGWAASCLRWWRWKAFHPVAYFRGFSRLDWGITCLVLLGAASIVWADHLREAAREFRTVVLEAGLFYGLLRALVRERKQAWRLADAWVLGASSIALVGLCQGVFGQNLVTAEGVGRVRGFYGSPNNLALYLGRVFPLALAVSAWGEKGVRRLAYAGGAALMAAAIVLTYSRGAWLFGIPAALLLLAALRSKRWLALTAGGLAVALTAVVLAGGTARFASLLDTTDGTTFFRLQLWRSSWAMVRDHPLLGVGLDNFLYHYRTYYVLPTAWEQFNLSHPHNLVLDFWLRLGLPGLALAAYLLVEFFRRGWQAYRAAAAVRAEERWLVAGLMAGMADYFVHGLVDNAFFLVDLAFAFVMAAALVQVAGAWAQAPITASTMET